uniref:WD repeat-containing protein 11 n=1 Tax=Meloidogyne javanica TaxID=6303 RepID=A0A915MSF8_MELJA
MPPTTLTSSLHPSNRDAIAWNEKGLIAFGCHSTLVLFDTCKLEVFQTLEQHTTAINLVCWKPPVDLLFRIKSKYVDNDNIRYCSDINVGCASSDISGNIFIWDIQLGIVVASLRYLTTNVNDLKWLNWPNSDYNLLLSIHSNSTLILWNIDKKERIWEHKFNVSIYKISMDPFDQTKAAVSSIGSSLILLEKLSSLHWSDSKITSMSLEPRTIPNSSTKLNNSSSIIQLKYHLAYPQLLFVLFPTEICLVETQHCQVIFSSIIDTGSPLVQILPCAEKDAFFLIHQNGTCSFRLANFHFSDEKMISELDYERKCSIDSMQRQSIKLRVMGVSICPTTNSSFVLLINSGKLLIYQLEDARQEIEPYRIGMINDFIELNEECQMRVASKSGQLRLTQYGIYSPLSTTITVIRMRPIDLLNTSSESSLIFSSKIGQLAAVGSSTGIIHLINVCGEKICKFKDLQIHSCPVKCLEWAGPNAIVSAAYIASLSSSNTVRNDMPEREESPIETIRVSHYNSYLAISFRQNPLEIWDLGTQRLLRRMNKRCPIILDMCWSGKHHQSKIVNESKTKIFRENLVVLDNDNHLYHVVVKGLHVRDGKEVSTQWKSGAAFLRCMAQHPTSLVIWDTERLHTVFVLQRPGLSVIDIDMCGLTPVYVTSDGMLRYAISDTGKGSNISLSESDCPFLIRSTHSNKRMELIVRLLLSTCKNENHLEQAIEKCIIMKKNELAIYYLLNSDKTINNTKTKDDIKFNSFRACLLSANFDSENSKCLVKLNATNLIASNFISEGIQLLSLIDQGLDACKYLISQGLWNIAIIYSKIYPNCDFVEIYTRYAEYLITNGLDRNSLALMIFASLGNWQKCKTLIEAEEEEMSPNKQLIKQIIDVAVN